MERGEDAQYERLVSEWWHGHDIEDGNVAHGYAMTVHKSHDARLAALEEARLFATPATRS